MFYERLHIVAVTSNDDTSKDPDKKSELVYGGPISGSDILIPTVSRKSEAHFLIGFVSDGNGG